MSERVELLGVTYHYIGPADRFLYPGISGLTPDAFREQVAWLGRHYEFVSAGDVARAVAGEWTLPRRSCCLTFDDGLLEHAAVAWPILHEQRIPATFFVCGAPLEGRPLEIQLGHYLRSVIPPDAFWDAVSERLASDGPAPGEAPNEVAAAHYRYDDAETARQKYRLNFLTPPALRARILEDLFRAHVGEPAEFCRTMYMGALELQSLAADGAALGLHSHNHLPLALLGEEKIRADLVANAAALERAVPGMGRLTAISYPFGGRDAVSATAERAARAAGSIVGFTTERAINVSLSRPLLLARLDANDIPGGKRPQIDVAQNCLVLGPDVTPQRSVFFDEETPGNAL